jgi:hypothetical protein
MNSDKIPVAEYIYRYRKKLPAPAANQIAGNKKISLGMNK